MKTKSCAYREFLLCVPLTLSLSAGASAQTPAPAPSVGETRLLPDTPLGSGDHRAIMEVDPGLPTHTLYHPKDLANLGPLKLPVVLWANGGCINAGNRFRQFLTDISSYGYFVVAIGPIDPKVTDAPQPAPPPGSVTAPPPPNRTPLTNPGQLIDGLTWILAENDRPASRFFHRVDPSKIAMMGQSCGGLQVIEASVDPRVSTAMIWNSGILPEPTAIGGGKLLTKEYLKRMRVPIAYISGDAQDVAFANANDDFERLTAIPVFRAYERGVPHIGTYREPNGGEFAGVGVAWLNWQLKGDNRAALMFKGSSCGLCVNPKWVVHKKNLN